MKQILGMASKAVIACFALGAAQLLTSCANTDSNGAVITRTPGGPAADTPATTSPIGASNALGTGIGAQRGSNGLGGSRGSF